MKVKKIIFRTMLLFVFVFSVSCGMVAAFSNLGYEGYEFKEQGVEIVLDEHSVDDIETPESFNMLLIGTDASNLRSDTAMLVCVDSEKNQINILSIPRDTRVFIKNSTQKINACIPYGKDALLFQTIKELTGVPIHYYFKVNFDGFRNVIDILDGIDFEVPRDMKYSDPEQDLYIDLRAGMQHLDGDKAEQVVRFRRYAMGDLDRVKVQQDFMKALFLQKLKPEYLLKAPQLYGAMEQYLNTNFNVGVILDNTDFFANLAKGEASIQNFTMPGTAKTLNGLSYFIHDVDGTLELCQEYFLGSGQSEVRGKYITANKNTKDDSLVQTESTKKTDEVGNTGSGDGEKKPESSSSSGNGTEGKNPWETNSSNDDLADTSAPDTSTPTETEKNPLKIDPSDLTGIYY